MDDGGIAALETLQFHENPELYRRASAIIDKYFDNVEVQFLFQLYFYDTRIVRMTKKWHQ